MDSGEADVRVCLGGKDQEIEGSWVRIQKLTPDLMEKQFFQTSGDLLIPTIDLSLLQCLILAPRSVPRGVPDPAETRKKSLSTGVKPMLPRDVQPR